MPRFFGRIALWTAMFAFLIASDPTAAFAAGKRKAKAKAVHRKKPVAAERLVPAIKRGQPNVQARASLVLDDSGAQVFAHNPDAERPIASISKLAAVLVVMDKGLEMEGLSTINKTDVEVGKGGAKSRLLEGMTLSNRDLLHAAMLGSDNRAVPALGRAVKLTPSQLTAGMNAKAKQLGLKNTRFREPTGLSVENVSTPREVIAMLKQVVAHPVLGPISRRPEYEAHPVGKPPLKYVNTDRQAARSNVQLLGGKTGYNDFARYCLTVATKIDGRTYYMAFLGDEGKLTRFGDVARVADFIVSGKPKTAIAAVAPTPAPAPPATVVVPYAPPAAGPAAAVVTATETKPVMTATGGDAKAPQPPIPIGVAVPPAAQPQPAPTATR